MFALLGFVNGVREKVREIVDPGISRVLARVFQR
jgi:hypothetical protein